MKSIAIFALFTVAAAMSIAKPPLCSDKRRHPGSVCCDANGRTNRMDCLAEGSVMYHYCRIGNTQKVPTPANSIQTCGTSLDGALDACYKQSCGDD